MNHLKKRYQINQLKISYQMNSLNIRNLICTFNSYLQIRIKYVDKRYIR